jgi:hypothetical protein
MGLSSGLGLVLIILLRAIRDRWPPIELILTSGRHRIDSDDLQMRGQFVPKPYSCDVLVTTIKKFAG